METYQKYSCFVKKELIRIKQRIIESYVLQIKFVIKL